MDGHDDTTGPSRAWVYVDADDAAVAYLMADILDLAVHIEQVSVHPSHSGQGLGRALIDHVAAWGQDQGVHALTLTTFTDVPWNGAALPTLWL